MGEENKHNSTNVKTPSSSLTEEQRQDIQQRAEEWKRASDRQTRLDITHVFKTIYKNNEEANNLFKSYKNGNKVSTKEFKSRTPHNDEAVARQYFADILKDCIKQNFYANSNIDVNDGIFLLDENCNLPAYFWTRMNTNVLPHVKKVGCNEKHAWKLAAGIIQTHRDELNDRLRNTAFEDLKHVSNSIIQFLNKYMISTYKMLVEKNKEQLIQKKKIALAQQEKEKEQAMIDDINRQKQQILDKKGGTHVQRNIGFDISELL